MLHNGLNQLTQVGSTSVGHDPLGNLETGESAFTYGYDLENRLRSAVAGSTTIGFSYDPLGLLNAVTSNGVTTEFLYDGPNLVAEYDGSGAVLRRYVHGAGMDQPLVWYEGSGTTDRRYLHADERGSIVAISGNSGAGLESFKYSPDGESANAANSRFGYTGQVWLAEVGLYYYKSRMYSPELGRFLQPDAIGYGGGMNLYAYVGGDPINRVDPLGFDEVPVITFIYQRPRFYDTFERDLYFLDLIWRDYDEAQAQIEPQERKQRCTPAGNGGSIDDAPPGLGFYLPPFPDGLVDFSAGLGDALLFGAGNFLRDKFGIDGGVDRGSGAYRTGGWTSFAFGASRVGYAAAAKGYSIVAPSGAAASAFRASIRSAGRLGMAQSWRAPNVAKYTTDAALKAAAGRTNPFVNMAGAGVAAAGAYGGVGAGCN